MWKEFLWNFGGQNFSSQPLWMKRKISTLGCGKKSANRLNSFQVIHINFYYDSCYYKLDDIYIYFYLCYSERTNIHALYL